MGSDGVTGPNKKFDDIFSRVDTIRQRDGQTDGQPRDDSKDRAYAQCRAGKKFITRILIYSNSIAFNSSRLTCFVANELGAKRFAFEMVFGSVVVLIRVHQLYRVCPVYQQQVIAVTMTQRRLCITGYFIPPYGGEDRQF